MLDWFGGLDGLVGPLGALAESAPEDEGNGSFNGSEM